MLLFTGCNTDLQTKQWASKTLKNQSRISLFDGYVGLSYVENKGMAFGLFQKDNSRVPYSFLTGLTLIANLFLVFVIWLHRKESFFFLLPLFIILSGALGNLLYKLRFGYVVDFIHINLNSPLSFPYIFNIADILINVGMCLFILRIFFIKDNTKNKTILPAAEA